MSRSLLILLLGTLHVAPCLGREVGGDGEIAPAPVSVSPSAPTMPTDPLPVLFATDDSAKAAGETAPAPHGPSQTASPGILHPVQPAGPNDGFALLERKPSGEAFGLLPTVPSNIALSQGKVRSSRQTGTGEWAPLLDRILKEPWPGILPTRPGQAFSTQGPVRFQPQSGLFGGSARSDREPSQVKLGYRSPFPGQFTLSPERARSDHLTVQTGAFALLNGDPPAAGTSSSPPGPGPLPPTPIPVRSSQPTGRSSWVTYLDGQPIDVGPSTPQPGPPQPPPVRSETEGRFGWWGGGYNGSPSKVGEYQGLGSSPFWDIDTIRSDGRNTLDLWGSQLNNESWDLNSQFYRDGFKANVDFEQFPHNLGYEPPSGGTRQSSNQVVSDDLNPGQDSAVRVQQLKVGFSGPLTEHISWKLKVWEFHKFGERQVTSTAHCFNVNAVGTFPDNRCHVVGQQQRIDWLTMEIEPGLVAKFDRLTVDYTRTMRSFTQNDQVATAPFNHFGAFGGAGTSQTVYPYALVPNSTFQMDRLKLGYDFTKTLRFYSYLYSGDMYNESRDTNNAFAGFDMRLIKTTPSGVTATAYAKLNENHSQLPPFLLPEEQADPSMIWHPINYTRLWTGVDGQWFPFRDASTAWRGLSVRANYEFHEITRTYATYPTDIAASYVLPPTVTNGAISGSSFTQPTTRTHQFILSGRMRWDSGVITYARYQMQLTQNPLYGMDTMSGILNTNLPTDSQLFEIGGSWSPMSNLLLSVRAEIQATSNSSHYANFAENNYPVLCTIWYAPTPKLSLSAGYSYFSNWVNQDVTMGFRGLDEPPPAETIRVGYNGQTQVVNVGGRYAWSEKLSLSAGLFWTDGYNVFNMGQSQTGANWSQLPLYSDVRAVSTRYQGGFDYRLSKKVSCYFRVNVFDYQDQSQGTGSGLSYFFLGGLSGVF